MQWLNVDGRARVGAGGRVVTRASCRRAIVQDEIRDFVFCNFVGCFAILHRAEHRGETEVTSSFHTITHSFELLIAFAVHHRTLKVCKVKLIQSSRKVYNAPNVIIMSSSGGLNIIYSILTVLGAVSAVIFCIAIGWFLIWKLFLSRFEFINEIVNSGADEEKSRRAPSAGQEQVQLRRSSR